MDYCLSMIPSRVSISIREVCINVYNPTHLGAIEYTQNSLAIEKSTSNDAGFLSNGLLDDDLHVTDAVTSNLGFEHTGLLNSLPEKSIANIENESRNLFNDPWLLGMDAPGTFPV